MNKPKKNDDEKLIHDTEVLLQKYGEYVAIGTVADVMLGL